MASRLLGLGFDAHDPRRLARFWAGVLRQETAGDGLTLLPGDDNDLTIGFEPTDAPKTAPNRMHFDLTSASPADQQQTVARSIELGARHIDIGQRPEEGQVVLADPEGNEFCVIEPGNDFLAGCGFLGALNCDGSQQVGYFWSEVLGWPLVWDHEQETAIQSPAGGVKIAWGGPPVAPKTGKNRLHLHVGPAADETPQAEIDRLVSLGATLVDIGHDVSRAVLTDPDDNEFWLLLSR
jgi:hypothetical protein